MKIERAFEAIANGRKEAERIGVPMTLAVVDAGGHLIAFARMDGGSYLTNDIAIAKAHTAAGSKMATADLEQAIGAPHIVASLSAATDGRFLVIPGGAPISEDGEIVGAIGVSGGSAEQDAQVAEAAVG
jgi:cob(I)alamin adenosyltransferase